MRYFHSMIHMGNCNLHDKRLVDFQGRDNYLKEHPGVTHSHTFLEVSALRLRFEDALSRLSGMQQPGGTEKEIAEDTVAIEDIVSDIAVALTGKEVLFLDQGTHRIRGDNNVDPHTWLPEIYRHNAEVLNSLWATPETIQVFYKFQQKAKRVFQFTCPNCGAQHERGPLNGVDVYRCLKCGTTVRVEKPSHETPPYQGCERPSNSV